MKFSKRAGAMLLAVGAGMLASQGSASAAPMSPDQVGALEDKLATQQVPADVPLAPLGSHLQAGIPTSLVMPPVPGRTTSNELIPDHLVPQLSSGKVGPSAKAELPLPLVDKSADLGEVLLEAPTTPLHATAPGLAVGKPLALAQDGTGQLADGRLKVDELDPRLVTGAVQAVPGATASLGSDNDRISVTDKVNDLTETATATTTGVVQQSGLTDLTQL
ncbi:hypothetical protein [Streptomyces rubellomurinus]|uniref:ATP-binding protein n=2 Tax=Streptomyces TaxID=1883 RepID=A0A0F2TDS2_STRR3|nr:hypothetical protein [Streptomyces rubellomurinus]KJS55329.1 hypothetical protein VM98_13860 [Streptomyces rubellomurinus subsp. indigoferus]KJS60440.1 hypothetical protein VM95_21065 [Streptomyces rubellomurinus]